MKLSRVHGNLTEKIKEQRRAGFFIGPIQSSGLFCSSNDKVTRVNKLPPPSVVQPQNVSFHRSQLERPSDSGAQAEGDQTALKASWTESVDPFFYYKSRCLVLVALNVLSIHWYFCCAICHWAK